MAGYGFSTQQFAQLLNRHSLLSKNPLLRMHRFIHVTHTYVYTDPSNEECVAMAYFAVNDEDGSVHISEAAGVSAYWYGRMMTDLLKQYARPYRDPPFIRYRAECRGFDATRAERMGWLRLMTTEHEICRLEADEYDVDSARTQYFVDGMRIPAEFIHGDPRDTFPDLLVNLGGVLSHEWIVTEQPEPIARRTRSAHASMKT